MTNVDNLRQELLQARLAGRIKRHRLRPERTVDREGPLPLSFGQLGIWFLSRLRPDSAEYLVPLALRLRGPLDTEALRTALHRLVTRHEVLRTRYELLGAEPVQVIDEPRPPALPVVEVVDLVQALAAEAREPIDIERDHPLRVRLLRLGAEDHVLSVVLHHIACDYASLGVFTTDLAALYAELTTGVPADLPELTAQYADYAVRQRERVSPEVQASRLQYWRQALDGLVPTDLPTDRLRPAVRDWAGDEVRFLLPAELADKLRKVAAGANTTLFVVLLTAYQVLLARYTGVSDVVVGSAVGARTRADEQRMIGYLQNTLVSRARWAGDPTFARLVELGRARILDGLDNQEIPLHLLVEAASRQRDPARSPLFQVMFDLVESAAPDVRMPGLRCEPVEAGGELTRFDLTLQLAEENGAGLRGGLAYATALFDRPTVERMVGHFLRLLEAVSESPHARLSELDILHPDERCGLLRAGNGGPGKPEPPDVSEMVARHAARTPDAPAVESPGWVTSYGELDAVANRVARRLAGLGVGSGSVVGICLERGEWLLPALLGVWRAGAAYVPLDPEHPAERLSRVLDDAGAELVLTQTGLGDRLPAARCVLLDREATRLLRLPPEPLGRPIDPDTPAYIIYTSGSTGTPNGVLITHGSLANYLSWARDEYAAEAGGGAPLFSSVAFDLVVTTLYVPLLLGRTVYLIPPDVQPAALGAALVRHAPYDFVKLTPGHLDLLTAQLPPEQAATLAGTLVVGGEAFPTRLAARWPHTRVINEYGPTESTVADVTYLARGDESGDVLPIGAPVPCTTAYVLDGDLALLPAGVVGELCIGGGQLALGYRGRPALTADRFRPDPYGPPGGRLYRTGDACRALTDGTLEYLSRTDHQVKIRGYRVEPAETEAVLARHPEVSACVAMMKDEVFVGYVVPVPGNAPKADELRSFLADRLPSYMIPAVFVTMEEIPLTTNGKVDRRALPAPTRGDHRPTAPERPEGELHERMAQAWRSVLGLDEVGVTDSFFDLGGDSLHAVALVGALREHGLDVQVQDVFERPSIAELADLVAARPSAASSSPGARPFEMLDAADRALVGEGVEDAYPLSLVQAGMVYEMLAGRGDNHYHNTTTYRIRDGRLFSVEAMRAAADIVVRRHEALRTSIDLDTFSEPLQLVRERARLQVDVSDLRGLDEEEQERRIEAFMAEERRTLFDLGRPSLLRMRAHIRRDDQWSLTITECHPILEGWSYNVLFMELLTCYDTLRDGRRPELEELPALRFADFIAAERAALANEEDRAYWRETVTGTEKFELPPAWADTAARTAEQYKLQVRFDDLLDRLTTVAQRAKVPLKSVLHLAHLKIMSMLTPQRAFFTGLVCDARPEAAGADRVLGMFLNTVPFAVRLTGRSWLEAAGEVFAKEKELWPHRRFPVPAMQKEFSGGQRLIDVMFNFLDFRQVDGELVDVMATVDDSPNEFPLSVTVFRLGIVELTVHAAAIRRELGERLGEMYRLVLEAIAADPEGDARAAYLPAALLPEVGEPVAAAARAVQDAVAEHAAARPDRAAIVCGQDLVTYAELDAEANRIAHHLRDLGAGPDTLVGVCLDAGPTLISTLLGVLRAGAAYLPLDPAHPSGRLAHCLADSGARLVITEGLGDLPVRQVRPSRDRELIAARPDTPPPVQIDPDSLAYVIYTSGSTGRPKGVMVTHRGLGAYLAWAADRYGPAAAHGAPLLGSVAFDLSVTNLFVPLLLGRAVEVLPRGNEIEHLAGRLRAGADFTLVKATPSHLELLRDALEPGSVAAAATMVIGGEDLRAETVAAWRRIAPAARFVNEYGPTETVVGCTAYEARQDDAGSVPIGRPISGAHVRILDESLQPVPAGVAGEIFIGGAGVARGYLDRPALTAASFVPDPYGPPGSRLYRSGDLGVLRADGELGFLGRADEQIKIRGYRIEPGEIEARLCEHPGVREAVVAVRPEHRADLVAYTVGTAEPADLAAYLGEHLPAHMVPRTFLRLDALPLGPSGKVDRKLLPRPAGIEPARRPYVEPATDEERALARVWATVLGLDRVGADDDFFDLGGDSMMVIRAVAAARREGLRVSARLVSLHRTVRAVAAACSAEHAPAEPDVATGFVPPTPIRLAFEQEGADFADYTQVAHLTVDPAPDADLLDLALHDVVDHHDTLRLREDGIRADEPGRLLQLADIRDVPPAWRARALRDLVRRNRPSLRSGPAVRAVLATFGYGEPAQLAIAAHRLSVDAVSWQFILSDLATAYGRREAGASVVLPPKTTSFRTWARRLSAHARSEEVRRQLGQWLRRGPHEPIPADLPGDANTPGSVRELSVSLPMTRPPARLRDALLAALLLTVTRRTGSDRLLVELEGHGRQELFPELDISRTTGWFTTFHPVELRLPGGGDCVLGAVSRTLAAVPDGGIGYGLLRYLGEPEDATLLAALPEPQIRVNYTGWSADPPGRARFAPRPGGSTPARAVSGSRSRDFEIDASVHDGVLEVIWAYSADLHREATVRALAESHLADLTTILTGRVT